MDRRSFLKQAVAIPALAGLRCATAQPPSATSDYRLFWGDLHCHCGISYGRGSLEDALGAAREQRLDFCAVVGHSSWHDTPRDAEHMARIKDYIVYHDEGYERLERLWPDVERLTREARVPGRFVPFLAFEWHSIRHGDHNVYYLAPEGPIVKADSIAELREKMRGARALIVPHHIAYSQGSRGINWDEFKSSDQSPFVEVYSFHGCSVSDTSPYPMLREMGPRSSKRTMEAGLARGHRFGIIGSTDNHYGYPGSYGEGKAAVYARELTAESLWEAFQARRVYAATGDRIAVDFSVNGHMMGQTASGGTKREIAFSVRGDDFIDYVEIVKNGRVLRRFNPESSAVPSPGTLRAKVRVEWGWGQPSRMTEWRGTLRLADGVLHAATPCFRAQPSEGADRGAPRGELKRGGTLISRIADQDKNGLSFHSYSFGNPTPLTPINNSIVLDVEMPVAAVIRLSANGREFEHTLGELLEGQQSHLIGGYLDAAVTMYRAAPESSITMQGQFVDEAAERDTDYYYLRVRQVNNQWAWTSPIWISA